MPDFECPSCGGGFPATADGDSCPWCGEAMDGDGGPRTVPTDPTATRIDTIGARRDIARREFERDIGSDTHPFIDPDPFTSIGFPDSFAPDRGERL